MKNIIKEKMESLTEEELKQCFVDITEYSKHGMMGDTLVRNIRTELAIALGDKNWDCAYRIVVIPEILYEIAKRHFNYKDDYKEED